MQLPKPEKQEEIQEFCERCAKDEGLTEKFPNYSQRFRACINIYRGRAPLPYQVRD